MSLIVVGVSHCEQPGQGSETQVMLCSNPSEKA